MFLELLAVLRANANIRTWPVHVMYVRRKSIDITYSQPLLSIMDTARPNDDEDSVVLARNDVHACISRRLDGRFRSLGKWEFLSQQSRRYEDVLKRS